ncbi:helix-turn-helix domain-containing protein [Streptomyces polyrhachis]|uniref:Helix-turn-helix domain-containing protein n=1 Tax=Streptomyces polyrhachis TaxID=1282885 RepID=A0ABW2G9S0_9ACTN
MSETWTIGELARRAAQELGPEGAASNGRVRELPSERLIRWYGTIGLVDPPLTRRGRVALYGERHLLQLVAVKRLQARGHSIAEIQTMLAGAPEGRLREAAELPAADGAAPGGARAAAGATPAAAAAAPPRGRFWAAEGRSAAAAPLVEECGGPVEWSFTPTVSPALQLAPGVTLLLAATPAGRPTAEDLTVLTEAAAPLLDALHRRGLLQLSPHLPPDPSHTDPERSSR